VGWIVVTNGTNETIPPYGVCKITSLSQSTGIAVVGKVSVDGDTAVFVNGQAPIPPGESGSVHCTFPALAAYLADNDTGASPAHGETWKTKASSWYLHKGDTGFEIVGAGGFGVCNIIPPSAAKRTAYSGAAWEWTDIKTANYTAAAGEAVICDASGGGFAITLPSAETNDQVLIVILNHFATPSNYITVDPGSSKLNGSSSPWIVADVNAVPGNAGAGGSWQFVQSGNSTLGWAVSRYLTT
jgi:hypothetical protein